MKETHFTISEIFLDKDDMQEYIEHHKGCFEQSFINEHKGATILTLLIKRDLEK